MSLATNHFLKGVLLIVLCRAGTSMGQGYHSTHFAYAGSDLRMLEALQKADAVFALPTFWDAMRNAPGQQLDGSTYTMAQLATTLRQFSQPITVTYSRSPLHWKATAGTDLSGITIFWKGYKQSVEDLALTLLHEWVHGVDFVLHSETELAFAHLDDQRPCVSRNTASYRIEQLVVDMQGGKSFEKRYHCSQNPD